MNDDIIQTSTIKSQPTTILFLNYPNELANRHQHLKPELLHFLRQLPLHHHLLP